MSETPAPTRPLDPGLSAAELTRIVTELSYDLDDARAANRDLREALQQALPWMGMTQARMENDPHSHPQARTNIKSDIERARAALERAGEGEGEL